MSPITKQNEALFSALHSVVGVGQTSHLSLTNLLVSVPISFTSSSYLSAVHLVVGLVNC